LRGLRPQSGARKQKKHNERNWSKTHRDSPL
jgi:hypothetical protein